ncbi:glycosyltransferase family 2 protein [Reinekea sp.]|jgi:glycosyltransferase involved in cell wall biosynthesis|uniref:glycosyltransferase family 2 protein n=1 Tax=Reinekea sp. TaxID=1970455 RepID=UPI00398A384E
MSELYFSIVIPSYNRPDLALRAIKSAQANMIEGDELWIINDGSTIDYNAVSVYCDQQSSLHYVLVENGGVSHARNIGIENAKNAHIALLDDDDEWITGHLAAHRAAYKANLSLVAAFSDFFNGPNDDQLLPNGISRWSTHKRDHRNALSLLEVSSTRYSVYYGDLYLDQLQADHILPSAMSFNKQLIGSELRFELGLKRNESWLFSSSCCKKGHVAFVDASLAIQHAPEIHRATNISAEETMLSRIYVMEKLWGRDEDFLMGNLKDYNRWYFNDFYGVFRGALSTLKLSLLWRAYRIMGIKRFLFLSFESCIAILKGKKPITRNS